MNKATKDLLIVLGKRFARAFVASAAASMVLLTPSVIDYDSLRSWLGALAISGIVGGVTGLIQSVDKLYRYEPEA